MRKKIQYSSNIIFFILICVGLSGQDMQIILPSQLDRNMVYLDPAYTGFYETTVFSLMHRSTWLGFGGGNGPGRMFQDAEFHAPLKNQSIALGGLFRHIKEGGVNSNEAFLNYCHRIELSENEWLTFGIRFGGQFMSIDQDLKLRDISDDPAFSAFKNKTIPNAGVGIAYYTRQYYFGLSVPYLLNSKLQASFSDYSFILTGGGKIEVNNDIQFQPGGAFVYNISMPLTYQVQLNFKYRGMFLGGVGYRANDAIIATVGYFFNEQLSLNYSYDYNIGDIRAYSNGSHEIGLLFYFGFKINTVSPIDF